MEESYTERSTAPTSYRGRGRIRGRGRGGYNPRYNQPPRYETSEDYHEHRPTYYDYNRGRGRGRGRGRSSYYYYHRRPENIEEGGEEERMRSREYEEVKVKEEEEIIKEEEHEEVETEEDLEDYFTCPICAGPLDPYERNFSPCKCEFHMCSFCFNKIESENKICPGCRTPYDKDSYVTKEPSKEEINKFKMFQNKKTTHKKKKDLSHSDSHSLKKEHPHSTTQLSASTLSSTSSYKHVGHLNNISRSMDERHHIHHSSSGSYTPNSNTNDDNDKGDDTIEITSTTPSSPGPEKDLRSLADTRVVQRNLVYVTNIPLGYISHFGRTPEEVLSRQEYFGQYGKILKLVVNCNTIHKPINFYSQTVTCYVTYENNEDAIVCINAVNGVWLGSKLLRASYGTTKYCTYFLKGIECTNPNCLYLHELGSEQDSFTKESMILGKNLFSESVHPKVAYNVDGANVFPHISTLPEICIPALIHYDIASRRYPPRHKEICEAEKEIGNYKLCITRLGGIITAYLNLDNVNIDDTTVLSSNNNNNDDDDDANNEEQNESIIITTVNDEEEEKEEVKEDEKEENITINDNSNDYVESNQSENQTLNTPNDNTNEEKVAVEEEKGKDKLESNEGLSGEIQTISEIIDPSVLQLGFEFNSLSMSDNYGNTFNNSLINTINLASPTPSTPSHFNFSSFFGSSFGSPSSASTSTTSSATATPANTNTKGNNNNNNNNIIPIPFALGGNSQVTSNDVAKGETSNSNPIFIEDVEKKIIQSVQEQQPSQSQPPKIKIERKSVESITIIKSTSKTSNNNTKKTHDTNNNRTHGKNNTNTKNKRR